MVHMELAISKEQRVALATFQAGYCLCQRELKAAEINMHRYLEKMHRPVHGIYEMTASVTEMTANRLWPVT